MELQDGENEYFCNVYRLILWNCWLTAFHFSLLDSVVSNWARFCSSSKAIKIFVLPRWPGGQRTSCLLLGKWVSKVMSSNPTKGRGASPSKVKFSVLYVFNTHIYTFYKIVQIFCIWQQWLIWLKFMLFMLRWAIWPLGLFFWSFKSLQVLILCQQISLNAHYYNTVCHVPKILREQLDFEIGSMCFSKFKTVNLLQF